MRRRKNRVGKSHATVPVRQDLADGVVRASGAKVYQAHAHAVKLLLGPHHVHCHLLNNKESAMRVLLVSIVQY